MYLTGSPVTQVMKNTTTERNRRARIDWKNLCMRNLCMTLPTPRRYTTFTWSDLGSHCLIREKRIGLPVRLSPPSSTAGPYWASPPCPDPRLLCRPRVGAAISLQARSSLALCVPGE